MSDDSKNNDMDNDSKNNGHYFSTVDDLLIKDRAILHREDSHSKYFKSLRREIEILQSALKKRSHS